MFTLAVDRQSIRALDKLSSDTAKFRDDLADRSRPLKKVKRRQIARWQKHFRSEGGEYGRWKPLAPATVANRGGSAHPILIQSGRMLGWVNTQNNAGIVSAQSVHWDFSGDGSDGSYAVFHQTGSVNVPWRTTNPARKIWELDEQDESTAEEILQEYVDGIVRKYYS